MNFKNRNNIKAAVLLIVFGMNTLIGFACALGLDLPGSKDHHNIEAKLDQQGTEQSTKVQPHAHSHEKGAHHHDAPLAEDLKPPKESEKKDDCCSDHVVPLQQVDKAIPGSIAMPTIIFLTSYFHTFKNTDHPGLLAERNNFPQFDRWRTLTTIPDIRILIQSFQI